jgi:hypothetical protein
MLARQQCRAALLLELVIVFAIRVVVPFPPFETGRRVRQMPTTAEMATVGDVMPPA